MAKVCSAFLASYVIIPVNDLIILFEIYDFQTLYFKNDKWRNAYHLTWTYRIVYNRIYYSHQVFTYIIYS